jgi:G3E family GTPase
VRQQLPIPLHLLTGFLGAGKSTILEHVLADPAGERIAVLVNEVGDLALDHHLLETLDSDVLLLASGCVCCTIGGELFTAIERALTLSPTRIVVETTGIAEPAPIVHGLALHPRLAPRVTLCGVIAVVDAERGELLLYEPEAQAQVELADRVVISKVDLAPTRVAALRARIARQAPAADVREVASGEVDVAWLLASGPSAQLRDATRARDWLQHHSERDHEVSTLAVDFGGPVDVAALELWLRLVTQLDGDRLLRVKGIVEGRLVDAGQQSELFVLQSVQHAVAPLRRLEMRPRGWQGSSLVLITRGASEDAIARWVELAHQAARGQARVSAS